MALSVTRVANAMKSKWEARTGQSMPDAAFDAWRDLAEAVIEEVQANAIVNVTSVSGVTTGTSASGPGTGTIS